MRTVWRDGFTRIVKHGPGAYSLIHHGQLIIQGRFGRVCHYLWMEFLDT